MGILTLSKSIRSIDGEKFIVELNICGIKVLLSFSNIEQREYWHSLLSDYHLNYFVWRSTPLDPERRTSQRVVNGVHKLLKSGKASSFEHGQDLDTLHILYIEEILQKIGTLNITSILDAVPPECTFMAGRLVRVIMSVKFFFMSVLKSLSGADIPLPSRSLLISFLDEVQAMNWSNATNEVIDFYCDQCYRIMFNLSFAFTSNARDEIMKLNEIIDYKRSKSSDSSTDPHPPSSSSSSTSTSASSTSVDKMDRRMAEMKFEYESLQRSWKMHRDRLQEYVMAYRDAVAKLKHSYHQRDHLYKKVEALQQEKQTLTHSLSASLSASSMGPRNYAPFQYQQFYGPPPPFGAMQHPPPGVVESTEIEGNGGNVNSVTGDIDASDIGNVYGRQPSNGYNWV